MPGNYSDGVFEDCKGDDALVRLLFPPLSLFLFLVWEIADDVCGGTQPMGVYGTSTFFQGEPVTPSAHPAPASSECTFLSTIGNLALSTSTSGTITSAPTSTSTGSSVSGAVVSGSSLRSGSASRNATSTVTSSSVSESASESGSDSSVPVSDSVYICSSFF